MTVISLVGDSLTLRKLLWLNKKAVPVRMMVREMVILDLDVQSANLTRSVERILD